MKLSKKKKTKETFGAGSVSGTVKGDKVGRGLSGRFAKSRAGTRSLANQDISDSLVEAKGRKTSSKSSEAKVNNKARKTKSRTNSTTKNTSSKVSSNRKMTNKVTKVENRFKRSKSAASYEA